MTLEEVYLHLRLDPDNSPRTHPDDPMLRIFIQAAREDAEKYTRRSFVYRKLRLLSNAFPFAGARSFCCGGFTPFNSGGAPLRLLYPPIVSVEGVSYADHADENQPVDFADYFVTEDSVPELRFVTGFAFPTLYPRSDALRVDYWAGYPPTGSPFDDYTSNIPATIKAAILIGVQLLYDELAPDKREKLQLAWESLLSGLVVQSVT